MQHHPETHHAQVLAACPDDSLGHRGDPHGRGPEPGGLLRRAVLPGRDRVGPVPRRGVLLLHVVQATGEAVSHLVVLQRRGVGRVVWRYLGLC